MTERPALSPCAERSRDIPASVDERRYTIDAAVDSLSHEEQRLERLGFEWPLARCREQKRYWEFVGALHSMSEHAGVTWRSR